MGRRSVFLTDDYLYNKADGHSLIALAKETGQEKRRKSVNFVHFVHFV